jgi:hypothetical protein
MTGRIRLSRCCVLKLLFVLSVSSWHGTSAANDAEPASAFDFPGRAFSGKHVGSLMPVKGVLGFR